MTLTRIASGRAEGCPDNPDELFLSLKRSGRREIEGNEKTNALHEGGWSIEPAFSAPSICFISNHSLVL